MVQYGSDIPRLESWLVINAVPAIKIFCQTNGDLQKRPRIEAPNVEVTYSALEKANLKGVDLSWEPFGGRTSGLTQEQIEWAHGNPGTKLPEGLTHPAHWLEEEEAPESTE